MAQRTQRGQIQESGAPRVQEPEQWADMPDLTGVHEAIRQLVESKTSGPPPQPQPPAPKPAMQNPQRPEITSQGANRDPTEGSSGDVRTTTMETIPRVLQDTQCHLSAHPAMGRDPTEGSSGDVRSTVIETNPRIMQDAHCHINTRPKISHDPTEGSSGDVRDATATATISPKPEIEPPKKRTIAQLVEKAPSNRPLKKLTR